MKTKEDRFKTMCLVCIWVGLVLTPLTGQCFYNPNTGKWLSRDPVEESGGDNLYVFCGGDSVGEWDILGQKWTVTRNGGTKASAVPELGDTITDLADLIGLRASEYQRWLTAVPGTILPAGANQVLAGCESFEVPNTVVAYWAGWGRGVGRTYVEWNPSVKYLRARGFYVDERYHRKGAKLALQKIIISESIAKNLHGLYFWGYGYAPYPSTGLVSQSDDALLMYASPGLYYHMGLGLVFACDSNSGRNALMSGSRAEIWHGFTRTLVPTPWMQYHAKHFIKPGQQGTQ
jgi:hypothetical protein